MARVRLTTAIAAGVLFAGATVAQAETITIATVNNSDMIIMQRLSTAFEEQTGHELNWVILEENVLRQRVTTDIATGGGQFDIITIADGMALPSLKRHPLADMTRPTEARATA